MVKPYTLITLILSLLLVSTNTSAFPENSLRPGGVVILSIAPSHLSKPEVRYNKLPVSVVKGQKNWLAIVGISLKAKIGKHYITVIKPNGRFIKQAFLVKPHQYKTQRLTLKNKNKVNPNKQSSKRIQREYAIKQKLKKTFSNVPSKLNFIRPITGRDSGRLAYVVF